MKSQSTLRSILAIVGSTLLAVTCVSAETYYWDSNNDTAGFGSTAGTWSATTVGIATAGWSTSATGEAVVNGNSVTTTAADTVYFGTGPTGATPPLYNYAASTTISGTVNVGYLYQSANHNNFLAPSAAIVNFADVATFDSNRSNAVLPANLAFQGASTSLTLKITFSNNLSFVNCTHTYTGDTILQGPGRLAVKDTQNLGAASADLIFDGGILRLVSGTSLTNFSTMGHTVSFNDGKTVGLDLNNDTITFTVDQVLNQGAGGLFKENSSGTLILNQVNTYTGTTTIGGGELVLAVDDCLANTKIVFVTGSASTLELLADVNDAVGTFSTSVPATIKLGAGATLAFSDSSAEVWTGALNITGTFVSGSSIRFGTDADGLTTEQLAVISVAGSGAGTYALNDNGYLILAPVGDYSSWAIDNSIPGQPFSGDFNNDGITNGVAYALGLSPTTYSQAAGVLSGNTITFTKGAAAIDNEDVTWIIETSLTLEAESWTPAVTQLPGDASATISYTFTPGTPAKKFARLKAVQSL